MMKVRKDPRKENDDIDEGIEEFEILRRELFTTVLPETVKSDIKISQKSDKEDKETGTKNKKEK